MGATSLQAFQKALAAGKLAPAYYLSGDDEHRKDALVRQVIESAIDPAMREFNVDMVRGADADAERLEPMLQTLPMLASRRVVVVRDTGSLRKDARSYIEKYLESPAPDTVLLLVALAGTKEEKEFQNATQLSLAPPTGEGFSVWVMEHVRDVHGTSITSDAAHLLEQSVGRDTVLLASELDKLVSYSGGKPIDELAVAEVTGIRRGKTVSDLLDAVAARDAGAALGLIGEVLSQPKNNAVTVIMALTVQTLALAWGHYARGRADYYSLLKETGAFPMRPWGEAVKCWSANQSRWSGPALHAALRALREADQAAKDTRVASDEQLVATLVCAMCAEPSRAAA
jgi:DNA polymerase-3 subunit delta